MVDVDSRLLDCNSPEQIEENFNRVLKVVDDKTAATQADSTAVDVAGIVADHNALLAKLIAAGLMAAE